jgi:hypothetical protein
MMYKQLQSVEYVRDADLGHLCERVEELIIQWVDRENEYCAELVGAPFKAEGDYVQTLALYKWITIEEPKND